MVELFVYGTLMRGEPGHRLLDGARFIAQARTAPSYELVDMGGYPAMVDGGTQAITGEIHAVPEHAFASLDAYEDVPAGLYRRDTLIIAGRPVRAYVLPRAQAASRPRIRSGDWRKL